MIRLFLYSCYSDLLDLGFLVHHMLAYNRIKLFYFKFSGHGALVLGRCVEVTGTGAGYEFYLVTHYCSP